MSSTRLTYLQKVGPAQRPTHQGLPGNSPQLNCSNLATLAGPNPTEPGDTLSKQSTPDYYRTARNNASWGPLNEDGSPKHRSASPAVNRIGLREGQPSGNGPSSQNTARRGVPLQTQTTKPASRLPVAIAAREIPQTLIECPMALKEQWMVFPEDKFTPKGPLLTAETCL